MLPSATTLADEKVKRTRKRSKCLGCNGEKGPGKGRWYCDDCSDIVYTKRECKKCGADKGLGHLYCEECRELVTWQRERLRYPKRFCQNPGCCNEIAGKGHKLCLECKALKKMRYCERCPKPVRGPHAKLCADCKEKARKANIAKQVEWVRQKKKNPEYRQARYAKDVAARRKRLRSKDAQEKARESDRMYHRLRKGSEPVSLEEYRKGSGKLNRSDRLPIEPIVNLIRSTGKTWYEIGMLTGLDEAVIRRIMLGKEKTKQTIILDQICYGLDVPLSLLYGTDFDVVRGQTS